MLFFSVIIPSERYTKLKAKCLGGLWGSVLTVDLQQVFGPGPAVQLVDVLGDNGHFSALFGEPLLALGDGQVSRVWVLGEHDLTTVVIELPNPGRVLGEGLWSGQVLKRVRTVSNEVKYNRCGGR